MVSGKTGCSSWFKSEPVKTVCAISLSLKLFTFSLYIFNWYKQPIVFAKQPIVFLVLC